MARNWNKKYTVAVAITAFVAIILIAAMIIPAMYLLSYADEQWTIGLYFRNHQEYICAIDDEVAEFNFLGINVGKDEENIPSPERSVCYLAGYPASSFVFVDAGDNGRFDSLQLQVYISAPESFTATEVVFETDGVRTAYEIGMAVYDRIDTDDVESTNELPLSFSWYIDTGFDFSCQYSVDLKNNFEEQIAVDTVLLNHPDFENFSYSQASAGESELPVIVESVAVALLEMILTSAAVPIMCAAFNSIFYVSLLFFGVGAFFAVFGLCFGSAALSTVLPVAKLMRKKPVDIIAGR